MAASAAHGLPPHPELRPPGPPQRLLTTKLSAPRLRPSLVARPHLLDRITAAAAPLTLVCAPAGYGKSTLVTHWLIAAGIAPAWVSLDPHDDDPFDFFSLVVAAIRTIDPVSLARTQALLEGPLSPSPQAIVGALLADAAHTTRPFVLVLDDYHAITDPAIHAAMGTLLSTLPPTLRFVLITRTAPPLPLARLRGRGEVLDLGPDDLRFTDAEALDLLQRANGLEVTQGEVGSLNDRAEGWVAGLQLVGHVLQGQSPEQVRRFAAEFSGNVRSIETYLWEEAIDRQPTAVQTFLLQTSILDRFSGPLGDAVTGREDGTATIRTLEQERMFVVALDDVGRWHRYHHLFADVLRERLVEAVGEEEVLGLHRRAARWLEEEGLVEEAARHAVAGRDWERAVRLVERVAADLYEQDRGRLLFEWLRGLPDHVLARSPVLGYYLAFAATRLGRLHQAATPLRIAEEAWTLSGDRASLGLIRLVHALRSFVAQDAASAIALATQALDLLPDDRQDERAHALVYLGTAYFWAGDCVKAEATFAHARTVLEGGRREWLRLLEMAFSGGVLVQRGRLPDATVLLRQVCTVADRQDEVQGLHSLHRLGDIYVEWNLLADAEQTLRRADSLSVETKTPTWRGWIGLGLARAAWARGDAEAAFDELQQAIDHATETGWRKVVRDARALQARFWLATGRLALARRWAEGCDLDPYLPPSYERQVEHLTFVRLLLADDLATLALKLLDAIAAHATAQGRHGDLVEIAVLRALAHKQAGDPTAALAALDQALALGEPGGYTRTFAIEGEALAPLLRHAAGRGKHRDYATRLLAAIEGEASPAVAASADGPDALSEREAEVLRLVAVGLTNREIGQRLYISEKTVKKHMNNVLGKLQAANRTEAVHQARRLKLI
jgi:LuxR family maltose regulon positive regulatory protein